MTSSSDTDVTKMTEQQNADIERRINLLDELMSKKSTVKETNAVRWQTGEKLQKGSLVEQSTADEQKHKEYSAAVVHEEPPLTRDVTKVDVLSGTTKKQVDSAAVVSPPVPVEKSPTTLRYVAVYLSLIVSTIYETIVHA